jgi:hypothetical protein
MKLWCCPICGGYPKWHVWDTGIIGDKKYRILWSLVCNDGDHEFHGSYYSNRMRAIRNWNCICIAIKSKMEVKKMASKYTIILMGLTMVTNSATQIILALDDPNTPDEIDRDELLKIIQSGMMSVKALGVLPADLARFGIMVDQIEVDAMDFQPGDALIHVPGELLEKMSIKL